MKVFYTCSKLFDLKFSKPNISRTDIVCADELEEKGNSSPESLRELVYTFHLAMVVNMN
jgi:hypothetical protein